MNPHERVVVSLPLSELFDSNGPVAARHVGNLLLEQIRELLGAGPVRLVVVEPGSRPHGVPTHESFAFWKREIVGNVAAGERVDPRALPRGYCYFASR